VKNGKAGAHRWSEEVAGRLLTFKGEPTQANRWQGANRLRRGSIIQSKALLYSRLKGWGEEVGGKNRPNLVSEGVGGDCSTSRLSEEGRDPPCAGD